MKTRLLSEMSLDLPARKYTVKYRKRDREHIYSILADVSDKVKNNLTAVKGFTQLIQSKISGGLYDEYFEIIESEIEKIIITIESYRNNHRPKITETAREEGISQGGNQPNPS